MTRGLLVCALALATAACEFDLERMNDGQRLKPYEPTPYLPGGMSAQPPPANTVPTDRVVGQPAYTDGFVAGQFVQEVPVEVTRQTLERGRGRFEIFCGACHGIAGDGNEQVVKNMRLRPPPSLHEARIVAYPPGRLYRVVSQGYGLMPSYADKLSISDRWAVVAYVQALQLSQRVELGALPEPMRQEATKWLE